MTKNNGFKSEFENEFIRMFLKFNMILTNWMLNSEYIKSYLKVTVKLMEDPAFEKHQVKAAQLSEYIISNNRATIRMIVKLCLLGLVTFVPIMIFYLVDYVIWKIGNDVKTRNKYMLKRYTKASLMFTDMYFKAVTP